MGVDKDNADGQHTDASFILCASDVDGLASIFVAASNLVSNCASITSGDLDDTRTISMQLSETMNETLAAHPFDRHGGLDKWINGTD